MADPGPTLSVRDFGAVGDGQSLDTAAIQAAVDALPPGGTLRFPPGTYRIEADRGVKLKDGVRLELGEAVLAGVNVDRARCRLIEIQGGKGVVISGGTLVGSRSGAPEWGVGILASDAEDLLIENVTLRDFYFDGILLTGNRGCQRVVVRGVVAEGNRRTGLAVPAAQDVTVEGSTFRDTHGQSPEAGANFEPNPGGEVRGVRVRDCTFSGNAGVGLYVHRGKGVAVADVSAERSTATDNGLGIVMVGVPGAAIVDNRVSGHRGKNRSGIVVGDTSSATVAGNQLDDNSRGILSGGATGVEIRGNTVVGTGPEPGAGETSDGIVCLGSATARQDACVVTGNTVRRCGGSGIVAQLVSRVRLEDNTVEDVGQRGLLLRSASESEVRGNSVARTGVEKAGAYDAIELIVSSSDNQIAGNTIRLGSGPRSAIGICPDCRGNTVTGNVVLPY
ncbi:MAG TPA: right-handed parallel beta-helix repeat-containing protein [Vicinamibacteria bacterium]|nr:right-handed parallel beta-helix repeat-containing protein [Vicinamibacteria bacterium]